MQPFRHHSRAKFWFNRRAIIILPFFQVLLWLKDILFHIWKPTEAKECISGGTRCSLYRWRLSLSLHLRLQAYSWTRSTMPVLTGYYHFQVLFLFRLWLCQSAKILRRNYVIALALCPLQILSREFPWVILFFTQAACVCHLRYKLHRGALIGLNRLHFDDHSINVKLILAFSRLAYQSS